MSDNKNFKEGLKGTTLFGGVGMLNILISIVKSKLVAILLGPEGMGVLGLFNSSVDLINKGTNFSLRTSAVKDISAAYATNDSEKLSKTYSVFKKLITITGTFGLLVCACFSPYLSLTSFGNYSYTIPFVILALSFPFLQFSDGLNVLMQGTRHLKLLAKSNVVGNVIALLSVIPIYYIFGISGIVYTIVLGYFLHFLITYYYARKVEVDSMIVGLKQSFIEGKGMLKMGFFISLQSIFVALSAYIVRAYISNTASVDEVGLYTAGFYIINTYTGLVFSGMSTEYYPRLASMAENNTKVFQAVESQSILSIMLLAPLVCLLILLGNLAIVILYSEEFLSITMMISISMLGVFFKAPSWCLGYVYLGKGDSKVYFWNELVAVIYTLFFNLFFYKLWGLTGMGVSFLLSYFIYWIQQITVCKLRYNYVFSFSFLKILCPQLLIAIICLICSTSDNWLIKYLLGGILIACSIVLSINILKKNVNFSIFKKIKKHE